MEARDVTKGHARSERDAAAGIIPAKHARHVIADGIKPLERRIVRADHTRVFVGFEASEGADIAGDDPHSVEWTGRDRREARVRLDLWIAVKTVVGGLAFAEGSIRASRNVRVPAGDRFLESVSFNARH
jgi:hypothetical protein